MFRDCCCCVFFACGNVGAESHEMHCKGRNLSEMIEVKVIVTLPFCFCVVKTFPSYSKPRDAVLS